MHKIEPTDCGVNITMPVADILRDETDNNYAKAKAAFTSLSKKGAEYEDDEIWFYTAIIEHPKIKKEAQDVLNSVRSRYESKVYGLQQDKQRAERWEKAAEANAERWRNRFFSLWPDAAAAIEAIVMRCTTMIRSFTTAHIASIEKALRNARSMEERKEYASDLWDMAKDEMPGTTPKAWIQEGKKDLDLLVEYGPEQYLKQERSRTQNRGMHL